MGGGGGGGGGGEAAPCSALPIADENAVTESAVTTVSSSLFQSVTVFTKNGFLYCSVLLSGIFKLQLCTRDKVTKQCPQTTTFEEKGQPKQIRTEVPLLTSLTPYR